MKTLIPMAVLILLLSSCGRRLVGTASDSVIKDSTYYVDTVITKDRVVHIPSDSVSIEEPSAVKKGGSVITDTEDKPVKKKDTSITKKGKFITARLDTKDGKSTFTCTADSLYALLIATRDTLQLKQRVQSTVITKTITIQGPKQTFPWWVWAYIWLTAAYWVYRIYPSVKKLVTP